MGADNFVNTCKAAKVGEAFSAAVEEAAWEYGHGGYTGTIAEKHDFIHFGRWTGSIHDLEQLLAQASYDGEEAAPAANAALEAAFPGKSRHMVENYDDKWGPAVAVQLSDPDEDGQILWGFCGYASS